MDKLTFALLIVGIWPLSYGTYAVINSGVSFENIDGKNVVTFSGDNNTETLNSAMMFFLGLVVITSSILPLGIGTSSIYYELRNNQKRKKLNDSEKEKLV